MDKTVRNKLISVILVWIAFAILYLLLNTGDSMYIWIGIAIMAVANIYMALKN